VSRKPINEANLVLEQHLRELGFDRFVREYKFHPKRKWRFDYLLEPDTDEFGDVAIEIEGGIWTQGRHTRGAGFQADMEKYREAAAMTFKVFRFSVKEVLDGTAKAFIEKHCV
jgi:hypothetical protein